MPQNKQYRNKWVSELIHLRHDDDDADADDEGVVVVLVEQWQRSNSYKSEIYDGLW